MPTACVSKHYCGTHAPGWLSGSHPTRVGQVVNGKVCFHWGSNCCNWNAAIQIKKCNGFYVYKLARTPVCWLRYCGNAGFGELCIAFFSFLTQEENDHLIHSAILSFPQVFTSSMLHVSHLDSFTVSLTVVL